MIYDFQAIEQRWQSYWLNQKTFHVPNPGEAGFDQGREKFFVLDMFPYPSGVGLHVGHPLGYIATDIVARYKRMRGYNVLHPMGYDAFGLPAEQYAIETGVHPRETTEKNIANMTRQLKRLGLGYDWDRSVATTDVTYYKWTQWIFLQLFNSWFDTSDRKARPIGELAQALESERLYVGIDGELVAPPAEGLDAITGSPVGVRKWYELSKQEQRAVIDSHRLAYMDEIAVNWCPALGTVLANEEVTNDGKSERGNHPVFKRPLKQWMLRITAYCDRLAEDLELVDWPEPIKLMQRNWIGKSTGARVDFPLAGAVTDEAEAAELEEAGYGNDAITVFTTRPDTLFGATYMVLAPEHPLVLQITTGDQLHAVNEYRKQAESKSDVDRQAEAKEKTGVFTGAYAINPLTGERIPIWIADYVMMGYGTGAIMAVPAHDERDFAFAQKFDLAIRPVVMPGDDWLAGHAPEDVKQANSEQLRDWYLRSGRSFDETFAGHGKAINSANGEISLNGLTTAEAKDRIIEHLEKQGIGWATTQYKLRDWLFSRQRYWGEPFPILHGPDGEIAAVDESDLPVELPEVEQFKPAASDDPNQPPRPPLGNAPDSWKYVERNGVRYERELNTMPQWAGSCWYYLRYLDPTNDERFVGAEAERYWMHPRGARVEDDEQGAAKEKITARTGVDLYIGGAEHAVLHLLYARFWHKVLYDLGHVSTPEPFGRLFNQGYIQAHAYTDPRGVYVPAEEIQEKDGKYLYQGEVVNREFGKMGKSLKNAIAPDEIGEQYGFDTLRLYEMYLGPLDQSKVWNTRDVVGVHRFLQRLWRNFVDEETGGLRVTDEQAEEKLRRLTHKTIKRVGEAMENMAFNVAIAALIELNNELVALETVPREVASVMVRCLAPMAPHICEELWAKLGHDPSVADAPWPRWEEAMLVEESIEYPVQVNGKVRGRITVPADAGQEAIEAAAKADEKVATAMGDKQVRKVIVVPGRLVNLVVR